MELRCVHVWVSGLVQGVGYRAWLERQAKDLGVLGWGRNCRDGRVEARLQGAASAVAELLLRLERGPWGAEVQDVSFEDEPPRAEEADFHILPTA